MDEYDVSKDNLLANLPRTGEGLPRAGSVVIHDMLGEGGMGAVYLGFDENLAVEVAVKVLPFRTARDTLAVERFYREARSTFRVDHQNVVRVLTVAEEAGTYYLVMEFVDGESADQRLKRGGPLPERDALEIVIAAGEALAAAHAKGILHRDVKPANIMIRFDDGRVKVTDLGLAKALRGEAGGISDLTATGQTLGTPAYMSPEQAEDASHADERTDIYSLGATLYALLSGRAPFDATQILKLLLKVTREEPEDLRKLRSQVTERTAAVVRRLMAKDPAARSQTMDEAVSLLRERRRGAPAEGARGLARPEMAGKRGLASPTSDTATFDHPGEMTLDDVPSQATAEVALAAAAANLAAKRSALEERKARLEARDGAETRVMQVVDRDIGIARGMEDKAPAAALAALDLVAEELDALEERKRVTAGLDRAGLGKLGGEEGAGLLEALAGADGKLRSGRPREAKKAYGDIERLLGDAASVAAKGKQEHDLLAEKCLDLRALADSEILRTRAASERGECLMLVADAEGELKLLAFDRARSLIQEASHALNKARMLAASREEGRRRLLTRMAIGAAVALGVLGLAWMVAGRVKRSRGVVAEARSLVDAGRYEDALRRLGSAGWPAFGAGGVEKAARRGLAEAARKGAGEALEQLRKKPISRWIREADHSSALATHTKAEEAFQQERFEQAMELYGKARVDSEAMGRRAGAVSSRVLAARASAVAEERLAKRSRADEYAGERHRAALLAREQAEKAVEGRRFEEALDLYAQAEEGFNAAAGNARTRRAREEANSALKAVEGTPLWVRAGAEYASAIAKHRAADKALENGRSDEAAWLYSGARAGFEAALRKTKKALSLVAAAESGAVKARESAERAKADLYTVKAYRSALGTLKEAEEATRGRRYGEAEKLLGEAEAAFTSAAERAEAVCSGLRAARPGAQRAKEEAEGLGSDKCAPEQYRAGLAAWEDAEGLLERKQFEDAAKRYEQARAFFETALGATKKEFRRLVVRGAFGEAAEMLESALVRARASVPSWFRGVSTQHLSTFARTLSKARRGRLLKVWPAEAVPEELVAEFHLATRGCFKFAGGLGAVRSVAFSPDCRFLATGSSEGAAALWELSTGDRRRVLEGHGSAVNSVDFSPDGALLATASRDGTAALWRVSTGEKLRSFVGHEDAVTCVAFSKDGSCLVTGSWDRTAALWEVSTGARLSKLEGQSAVTCVAVSPDGLSVFVGSDDGTVAVFGLLSGSRLSAFQCHRKGLTAIALSLCGQYFATGSQDKSAVLWKASTGKRLKVLEGHSNAVKSVAFSPGGKYVLTGSLDSTAVLWEAATGKRLRTFEGALGGVNSVAFSPDGRCLASGSADSARIWPIPDELRPQAAE